MSALQDLRMLNVTGWNHIRLGSTVESVWFKHALPNDARVRTCYCCAFEGVSV